MAVRNANVLNDLETAHQLGAHVIKSVLLSYIVDHYEFLTDESMQTRLLSLDKELLVDMIAAKAEKDR
jgi:hypothetical protein